MRYRASLFVVAFATFASVGLASAQCPPNCPAKGGGNDPATDCAAELAGDALHVNAPFFDPAKPKAGKEIRCFDGDAGCDLDGIANNSCTFDIDVCLHNADPSLPTCTPADVTAVKVTGSAPALVPLQAAVDALLPASTNVCTSGQTVVVPLKGPSSKGEYTAVKTSFSVTTKAGGIDKDKYTFVCVPRGWPSHGYDANNTRATPLDTKITSTNVATMVKKWQFALSAGAVSATVTVGPKLVYTASWTGNVYALDKKTGKVKWQFNTQAQYGGQARGVQSSVTLTADGRALVGNSDGDLFCLDATKGTLLWQAAAGAADPLSSHAWASPTVANNRVLMGIASHNDAPCVRGLLIAYDLDTGAELWRQHTVPERVCYDNTAQECSANSDCTTAGSPCLIGHCDSNPDTPCAVNGDCPSIFLKGGTCIAPPPATTGQCYLEPSISCSADTDCPACVPGVGGGVTATPAVSPDGNDVYMASVGCLSRPSIGNSDAIFKLSMSTGAIEWTYRTESIEPYKHFPTNSGPGYHDFGFLNGPILAEVSDGGSGTVPVAVAGGKDGALYAVNQGTGASVWTNVLSSVPPFAGFGLFNGSLAYDAETHQFFAALFDNTVYPSGSDHLMSFQGVDGAIGWSRQIGKSWSSVTIANDVLYASNFADSQLVAYKKTDGTQLMIFPVGLDTATPPVAHGMVTGGAAVENGVIYIPFGQVLGGGGLPAGGVIAYQLPAAP